MSNRGQTGHPGPSPGPGRRMPPLALRVYGNTPPSYQPYVPPCLFSLIENFNLIVTGISSLLDLNSILNSKRTKYNQRKSILQQYRSESRAGTGPNKQPQDDRLAAPQQPPNKKRDIRAAPPPPPPLPPIAPRTRTPPAAVPADEYSFEDDFDAEDTNYDARYSPSPRRANPPDDPVYQEEITPQ
ncbi:hypothetical protein BJ508DRAFT_322870 [Ascobolus immersus RN42]|uniref:Uncharacterized protein n=1 Tax=Ascobolus immersus RN42 TaxID=1160509 RepID=A0A3N4ITX9_ASCIM|nr:hypothetical protein BJ508DRAFT_322870 [Ascobolus immersus RN42]